MTKSIISHPKISSLQTVLSMLVAILGIVVMLGWLCTYLQLLGGAA